MISKTMDRRYDLVGSLAFFALGIAVLVGVATYPPPEVVFDAIGPMGLPFVLGVLILVASGFVSIRTIIAIRRDGIMAVAEGTEDELEHPSVGWRAPAIMVGSFVYLLTLEPVGFLIMTPLAIFGALRAMYYRTWRAQAIVAVAFTIVAFVVFGMVLRVPLPHGLLDSLLFSLGLVTF